MTQFRLNNFSFLYENTSFRKLLAPDGTEMIRCITPAVRDRNWETVPFTLVDENIQQTNDEITITNKLEYRQDDILFFAQLTIKFHNQGKLLVTFEGSAGSTFLKNRIGLNLLLPVDSLAGCSLNASHHNGMNSQSVFPISIAPHQPLLDIVSVQWTDVFGNSVLANFSGDIFEMEDHRNWTDASYKIYSTPLAKPFPAQIEKGERVFQSIEIHLKPFHTNDPGNEESIFIQNAPDGDFKLPRIGLNHSSEVPQLSQPEWQILKELNIDFLGIQCDLSTPGWEQSLADHFHYCYNLNTKTNLVLLVNEEFINSSILLNVLAENSLLIDSVEVYHKSTFTPAGNLSTQLIDEVKQLLPTAKFGGGTYAYYAELNRAMGLPNQSDYVAFSVTPQVHAFDDLSLLENLKGLFYTVKDASVKFKKPVAINALTLKQRMNFVATGNDEKASNNAGLSKETDPRQATPFVALWTLGAMKNLIFSGAYKVNIYETVGRRGIMQPMLPLPGEGFFPETPLVKYPVFYIIKEICQLKEGIFTPLISGNEETVDGFLYQDDRGKQIWLWNYSLFDQCIETNLVTLGMTFSMLDFSTGEWVDTAQTKELKSRSVYRFSTFP